MPSKSPRVIPFPTPPAGSTPTSGAPSRRYSGVVATLSIDAHEVARLLVRDLADEWVRELMAQQGLPAPVGPGEPSRCGAPRRRSPHAPCRSTRGLVNGRCHWHQGLYDTPSL